MENKNKDFFADLLDRVLNYLDPQKTAIILICAVLAGLLGFGYGELFLKKEYRTNMTIGIASRATSNKSQNLSTSHHIADVMQALYDNDDVVESTLTQMKSSRTAAQFVDKLSVEREAKTVLVKISYTDQTKEQALVGIDIYYKNLCQTITQNLGYDCFEVLSPAGEPTLISHTQTVALTAFVLTLLIGIAIVVIRVFPGIVIITGADLTDFKEPVLGETFLVPGIETASDEMEEENEQ